MKHKTRLTMPPLGAIVAPSSKEARLRRAAILLETQLSRSDQDKVLLLLDPGSGEGVALLEIERLLRHSACQHVLWLVTLQQKDEMISRWEQARSWENGRLLREHFVMITTPPHEPGEAQLCIMTILDIQRHLFTDPTPSFFQLFDAVLLLDVPASPGPAWSMLVDRFAVEAPVIGMSETLSEEEGALFFGQVISVRRPAEKNLRWG